MLRPRFGYPLRDACNRNLGRQTTNIYSCIIFRCSLIIRINFSYPNGSARVTFRSTASFREAVLAEFVQVVTQRFTKTIQLDAYIEEGSCCIRSVYTMKTLYVVSSMMFCKKGSYV